MDSIGEQEFFAKVNNDRRIKKQRQLTWEQFQKVLAMMEADGEIKRMEDKTV